MLKRSGFYLITLIYIGVFYACSPKINQFEKLLDGVYAKPEVLTLHRDSVRVSIQGALPLAYLTKETKIHFFPEYQYGEGALRLGKLTPFDGEYVLNTVQVRLDETIVFPYLQGMEEGRLVIKAQVEREGKSYSVPEKTVAKGLNTVPLLARLGQITPDEPIPDLGIYMTADFSGINTTESREFAVPFVLGKDQPVSKSLPASLNTLIVRGEQGMAIRKVRVTGLVSPENQDLADPNLASKRSDAMKTILETFPNLKPIGIEQNYRRNDWFDFRLLLGEYQGITANEKEEYYNIILDRTDFESQLRKMRQLKTFNKVNRDIFPKLRAVKVSFILENIRFSDPEIAASVYRLLKEGKSLDDFTKEHLIYAGQKSPRLHEKEAIYLKLTEIFPSELSFNNLGVVFLNQAQRELDLSSKNVLISKAISMFRQANKIRITSVSMHNLGRALILRGDYFDAYVAISEASALERNETNEFLRMNEGVRGALDIINGDYKLATIRLNRAPENEINLFNKGLAYFLTEDLLSASVAFEESVQVNREFGYGFYGLAMVAAESGDKERLFENLRKAVERSEFLKGRALHDILFSSYQNDPEYLSIFK
ncbi:tetratricopeptide repeat protein [Shivajiella indica]|uniref:Tetratricopeptide repeat protein n=1 Tax=Shivajiella indica TaxID=872115 RepID=A0ABW5B9D1_9BACT